MTNAAFNSAVETISKFSHSDFRFSVNFKEFTEKLHWIRPNWRVRENQLAEYFWPNAQPETLAKTSADIARFDAAEYWGILDSFYTPDIEDLNPEQRADLLRLYRAKRPGQINAVTDLQFVCDHISEIGLGKTNFFWSTLIDLVRIGHNFDKALKILRCTQRNGLGVFMAWDTYECSDMISKVLDYGLEQIFKDMVFAITGGHPLPDLGDWSFDGNELIDLAQWFNSEEKFKQLVKVVLSSNPTLTAEKLGLGIFVSKLFQRSYTRTMICMCWSCEELVAIRSYCLGLIGIKDLLKGLRDIAIMPDGYLADLEMIVLRNGKKQMDISSCTSDAKDFHEYFRNTLVSNPDKVSEMQEWGHLPLDLLVVILVRGKAGVLVKNMANGLGISKAEATQLLKQGKYTPKDFLSSDDNGYCRMHRLAYSWVGARWWQAKKDSPIWDKVQRAYGPNGQIFEYTYRRLLDEIEEEDLIDGWKTSPEKAIKHAAERRQATVEGMLGCDFTPLPECPLKGNETFKQATTPAELVAKGKYFSNCVASYAAACKEKSAYIFTSEDICAEINPPTEDHDWYARQVLSFNNSLPSEESRAKFYAWFNEAVKEYKKKGKEK